MKEMSEGMKVLLQYASHLGPYNKQHSSCDDDKYIKEQKRTAQSIERLEKSLKENNMNTGGPAFPHFGDDDTYTGMTMRDYFAAKAMQALISSHRLGVFEDDRIANASYKVADAMLKSREQ